MSDDKKIIIDEDWKSQVAAEKEAAERGHATREGGEPSSAAEPAGAPRGVQLPPASFEMLVTMFATEAMVGLGQIPHPISQKFHADLAQARYAIDMLDVLTEKTKGNLAPGEEEGLRQVLHQLKLAFVAVQESVQLSTTSGQPEA